jgi:CDP-glycerol glycerophosphotransferase
VLITDYSSVLFDYASVGRPMVFFMYDLDTYATGMRGFYFDLAELPGPVVTSQDALVEAVRASGDADPDTAERYRLFQERFTYLDDGHASDRVLGRVMGR